MNTEVVTEAIRTLRMQGERISVRAVHQLTGGSFRDLSRILRDSRAFAEEEVAALEVDAPEPTAPRLSRIEAARQAISQAEDAVSEASMAHYEAQTKLENARAQRPADAVDPSLVAASIAAQRLHEAQIADLQRELKQLERIVNERQAARTAARDELARLRQALEG